MRFFDLLLLDNKNVLHLDGVKIHIQEEQQRSLDKEQPSEDDFINQILAESMDLVILDVFAPNKEIETDRSTVVQDPMKVALLTLDAVSGKVARVLRMEVSGYVLKGLDKDNLLDNLQILMAKDRTQIRNNKVFSGGHMGYQSKDPAIMEKLTPREKDILKLIVQEYTTEEIAQHLFISTTTVNSHRKSLLRKLQAKNVVGLVKAVYELGVLD